MRFDIVTIFPTMVEHALAVGVVGRAIERGTVDVRVRDLRDFAPDRHRVVDDVPYGGGPGMVMKPEPLLRALMAVRSECTVPPHVVLLTPAGVPLTQTGVRRLAGYGHLVLICGRYEGVDERVVERVDEEISIGDYVLSGGELAALVVVDAVARMVPGVVGDEQSVEIDSFSRGLLDYPHYTRPAVLEAEVAGAGTLAVPDVLASGHHAEIERWRKRQAVERTWKRRPALLETAVLDEEERQILRGLVARDDRGVEHGRH